MELQYGEKMNNNERNEKRIKGHNQWRANYDTMSYKENQDYYDRILNDTPMQMQYNSNWFRNELFRLNEWDRNLRVFELGGYQGELAHIILRENDHIDVWHNYEITMRAINHRVCNDEAYTPIVPDMPVWELPKLATMLENGKYNCFIASHTFEHLKLRDVELVIDRIVSKMDFALLEIPITFKVQTWDNYDGTHIFDGTWHDIIDMMSAAGFRYVNTGDNFLFSKSELPQFDE